MTPETRLGFAEEAYDSLAGAALRTYAMDNAQKFYDENPDLSVAELTAGVRDIYQDYQVGQSIHFKKAFIPHVANQQRELELAHSERLKIKGQEQHLINMKVALPGMLKDAKDANWTPEDIAKGIRDTVTGLQTRGALLGIDKSKVTEAAIDSLGSWMTLNPEEVNSPEEVFGWTKLADVSGFKADQVYAEKIRQWEDKFDSVLEDRDRKEKATEKQALQEQVQYFKEKFMAARESGGFVNPDEIRDEIRKKVTDYDTQKTLMATLDSEVKGEIWHTTKEVHDQMFLPFLNDDLDNIPTRQEIMTAWEDRALSTQDRDRALNMLSTVSSPFVTQGRKQVIAITNPMSSISGVTAAQVQAVEYFNDLLAEETQKHEGVPPPGVIQEITKQASELGKVLSESEGHYADDVDFFSRTQFKADTDKLEKEYLTAFPNATPEAFEQAVVSHYARVKAAEEAEQRAALQQYEKPIGPQEQDQVSPYQPVDPAKGQPQAKTSAPQQWMNDNVMTEEALSKPAELLARGLTGDVFPNELTGRDESVGIVEYVSEAIKSGFERVMSDFQRQQGRGQESEQVSEQVSEQAPTQEAPMTTVAADPYTRDLAIQENAPLINLPDDAIIMPNEAPEKGGGMDIGFGHKLTASEAISGEIYGIDYKNGITKAEAFKILEMDQIKHKDRAMRAVGEEDFAKLPRSAQNILTDLSFTGVLDEFPKLTQAILDGDFETMRKEYKRFYTAQDGSKQEIRERNKMTLSLIDQYEREVS